MITSAILADLKAEANAAVASPTARSDEPQAVPAMIS
jgi:hypothetical protein